MTRKFQIIDCRRKSCLISRILGWVHNISIWYQSRFFTIVALRAVTNRTFTTYLMMATRTRSEDFFQERPQTAWVQPNHAKIQMKCFLPYGRSLETDSIADSIITIFGITIVNSFWTELILFLGCLQHILTVTNLGF